MKNLSVSLFFCVVFILGTSQLNAQCTVNLGPDILVCANTPITLDAGGGFTTYSWSTAQVTQTIQVFTPGIYYVTVTDGLGNTCSDSVLVNFSPVPTIALTCINASCSLCSDGSIITLVSGGVSPYSYLWSNGAIVQSLTNLSPGTYTIWITDAMGCTSFASCTIISGPVGTGPYIVSGNVYYDTDSNGIKDVGENGLAYTKIALSPDNLFAFTDTAGNYAFLVDSGIHVVSLDPQGCTITSDSSTYTLNVTSGNYPNNDFGVRCPQAGTVSCYLVGSIPRCGWTVPFWINENIVTNSNINGYVKLILDTAVNFINATPPVSSINGDTLIWDFTTGTGSTFLNITCNLQMPLNIGYSFYTSIETALLDTNNQVVSTCTDSVFKTIICSYDPNDKAVEPEGVGPQHYTFIDQTSHLDYTIRFQNTGSDTAFNVVITDQLDGHLDINTFELLGSSHPVAVTMLNHLAEFRFNNILLPDSNVDEPSSHGYVSFRCNPIYPVTPYVLQNTADIFFDFNPAITTNTVFNTIDVSVGVNELSFQNKGLNIFPNPFSQSATIKFENVLHDRCELKIYDLTARNVKTQITADDYFLIEKDKLNAGVYFLEIENTANHYVIHGKFVIR